MRRIILAMLTFFFCFSWAEVKVEKVLETTSIKKYNQWVQKNKTKYPDLRSIYVTAGLAERSKASECKYTVNYFDENGDNKVTEEVVGKVMVKVSPYFDAIGIYYSDDQPYVWPAKSIIKNARGEILLDTQYVYLSFISPYLYLTIPSDDVSPQNPTIKIFNAEKRVWVNTLQDCWMLNAREVAHSHDYKFSVVNIETNSNLNSGHLISLDANGNEKWRKTFVDDPEKLGGFSVAISPDGSTITAGKDEKVYVYDSSGVLQREYTLPQIFPARCGVSNNGEYIVAVTRNNPKGSNIGCLIAKYDNKTATEIWRKNILEAAPIQVVLSQDGRYGLIQFQPNGVYLIDENGNILKQWDLITETHHPTAPSGKKITVAHSVKTRLEFHNDIIVIIHELNGEVFVKIWHIRRGND